MKKKDRVKEILDKEYGLLEKVVKSLHTILILGFIFASFISGVIAFSYAGTVWGTIAISFAVAFATATIVDFAYNYVLMKDVEQIVGKHLMLNKDVQKEIMKREKIEDILNTSLEYMIGKKLAEAFKKSIIDKIAVERDLFLMESADYIVILKNFTDPSLRDFFGIEMISKFNMTLKTNKATFYATDSDKTYEYLAQRSNDPSIYFTYYLPEGCGKILKSDNALLDKFLKIPELSIDSKSITENTVESQYNEDETVTIKIEFDIPKDVLTKTGEVVRIRFKLQSLLWKNEHYFFRVVPRAYPGIHMLWDCEKTDIEHIEVCHSFLGTQPEIERLSPDGRKINVAVNDWVLPNNMIIFIWRLKGEREEE